MAALHGHEKLQYPNDEFVRPIAEVSSIREIKITLAALKESERSVTSRLDSLVASQKDLARELGRLDLLRAQLGTQAVATRSISNNLLSDAASTANRVSGAVKTLDLEQARVKATLDVVEQVGELKACVQGVTGSMGAPQDWEQAASYLSRSSKIPKEIVCGSFAEEIVPSAEIPDAPSVTLENAAESLCGLFLREFEKAAKEDNGSKVTRFFKLFPLIGRPEVGLDVYGRYVCQGVAAHARANLNAGTGGSGMKDGFFYANALTKLFEYIAQIVERHGSLVERHYGQGRMVRVIERLQLEADVQGGIIIDTWSDERHVDRKLTDIKSYAFTFFVQSFLQERKNSTIRTASPATNTRQGERADVNDEENDGSDMKDVDGYLGESAVMLGRWALFCRFIAAKCTENSADILTIPPLISNSGLHKKISEKLISPFNTMMAFYFRRSVERAFQLDEQPADLTLNMNKSISSNTPYITSAVDDIMYIVNQITQRILSTSQRDVVANVIPTITYVLNSDFIGMIQRKMRDESYPRPLVQGGLPPEATIIAFIVLMNNLDISNDYIKRIITSKLDPTSTGTANGTNGSNPSRTLADTYPFNHDATFVHTSLTTLQNSFSAKTTELLSDAIIVLFKNVMEPRLRPVLADSFRDIDYALTADELQELDLAAEEDNEPSLGAEDAVMRRFTAGWEALTRPVARIATEGNFEKLLTHTVGWVARVLEKRIWGLQKRVNALGAVRLERDVAGIVGVVCKGGRYALREQFTKCTQICLIMNMEEEEWEEVQADGGDGMEWKLEKEERGRAKAMVRN